MSNASHDTEDSTPGVASAVPGGDARVQADGAPEPIETRRVEKNRQRRFQWTWNKSLAFKTMLAVVLIVGAALGSYFFHSSKTASTFLRRAAAAKATGNYGDQVKWLSRYSMLVPDDHEVIVQMAIAADEGAEASDRESLGFRVDQARKQLSNSLARLGETEPGDATARDLRTRLIKRLIQLGGPWFREAERQIILLEAAADDPDTTRSLAVALTGEVEASTYQESLRGNDTRESNYWAWLSQQKVGEVLALAIQQRPDDLDLIAKFVSLAQTNPELFSRPQQSSMAAADDENALTSKVPLDQRVQQVLQPIRDNIDSRSQLIIYQADLSNGLENEAIARLRDAAGSAAQRLANATPAPEKLGSSMLEMPASYWDYLLMSEAASRTAATDAATALGWYEQLIRTADDTIPISVRENVFLNAGRLHLVADDREATIEVWQRGVDEVNSNSLDLLGALATLTSQDESNPERAAKTLEAFRKQIAIAAEILQQTSTAQISLAQRTEAAGKIELSSWRLGVLDANSASRRGDTRGAIDGFRQALEATTSVVPDETIAVASQLALLYSSQGLWDQAAAALQKAVDLDPGNAVLRGQVAEAWTRAGNAGQALEQWKLAGNSASPAMQIASVEAMFNAQLKLTHEQRDFSGLRAKISLLREQFENDSVASNPEAKRQLVAARRSLELLEVSLPPSGVAAEDHLRSPAMADAVAKLSDQYVDDENIQAFAAERLAEAGRADASNLALERLEKIVGTPSTTGEYVRARIEASAGEHLQASQRLIAQAEREIASQGQLTESANVDASTAKLTEGNVNSAVSSRPRAVQNLEAFLVLAAEYAARANEPELAYQALSTIPADQRTLFTMFAMANFAKRLPTDSPWLMDGDKRLVPIDLSVKWEEQLVELEGDEGTYGLFLRATRLLEQLQNDSERVSRDDQRLRTVDTLVRQILSRRPRWGDAISLTGWISVLEGRPEQAVNQFRQGIASGDGRFQTRQQLFEQLVRLNREAEAEIELRETSLATDMEVDKYATTRIQLAQRQGDYERSLAVAQAAVKKRPQDSLGQVVLCLTATVAASEAKFDERREELFAIASEAIAAAEKLSDGSEQSVYSAKMRLLAAHGDRPGMEKLVEQIQLSRLDEFTKSNLKAQTLIALGEYDQALPMLIRAEEIKPSAQTKIALFQLYRKIGREDDAITALRIAQRRSPQTAELRNELARALAARDGAKVDWNELSSLLSSKDTVNGNNRLLYAILLGSQDEMTRKSQSAAICRELIKERNSSSDDASRYLAVLLPQIVAGLDEDAKGERQDLLVETRKLYDGLVKKDAVQIVDLLRYAIFLVEQGEGQDLVDAERLLRQLQSMPDGSLAALEVGIRLTDKRGKKDTTPLVIRSWAGQTVKNGAMEESKVSSVAGATLLKLGFIDEGLQWFERAYQNNPETVGEYVVALSQVGRVTESISVAGKHFQQHSDLLSGTLLIEALLNDVEVSESPLYQRLVDEAISKFDTQAALLESAATLRMQQGHLENAVTLYRKVQQLDPLRIRTLNNLAMALADLPGRASEGLAPINQALKLDERNPELLDTQGVVLLKAGRLEEAKQAFELAIRLSSEPRYQFHLIITLMAMSDEPAAIIAWKSLDLEKLDPSGLTTAEQQRLVSLKTEFGS